MGIFFFFFYLLPNPGTGLLALAKMPCPSVVGSGPDLGNMWAWPEQNEGDL